MRETDIRSKVMLIKCGITCWLSLCIGGCFLLDLLSFGFVSRGLFLILKHDCQKSNHNNVSTLWTCEGEGVGEGEGAGGSRHLPPATKHHLTHLQTAEERTDFSLFFLHIEADLSDHGPQQDDGLTRWGLQLLHHLRMEGGGTGFTHRPRQQERVWAPPRLKQRATTRRSVCGGQRIFPSPRVTSDRQESHQDSLVQHLTALHVGRLYVDAVGPALPEGTNHSYCCRPAQQVVFTGQEGVCTGRSTYTCMSRKHLMQRSDLFSVENRM